MYACTSEFLQSESESLVTKDLEGLNPSGIVAASAITILDDRNILHKVTGSK